MALTPDGRFIYVTVGRANEVVVIDTRSNAVAARIPAGELPWGVAVVEVCGPADVGDVLAADHAGQAPR